MRFDKGQWSKTLPSGIVSVERVTWIDGMGMHSAAYALCMLDANEPPPTRIRKDWMQNIPQFVQITEGRVRIFPAAGKRGRLEIVYLKRQSL